jgi:uncharacterized membrane protein YbhN (UPF0104 family)
VEGAEAASSSARVRAIALRVLATLVVAVLVVLALRTMDLHTLSVALGGVAVAPLALAAVLSFSMLLAKAGYWRTILSPVARVPLRTMLWYTISATGASVVLPVRGGEALRVYWLHKRHAVPLPVLAATVGFEKVFDITSLLLLVTPLPWLLPQETWMARLRFLAPLAIAFFLAHRGRERFAWIAQLRVFDSLRTSGAALACVSASWVADVILIMVVLYALGLPIRIEAALLVIFAANVAIAIPAAPGNVGSLELGVGFALTRLGVPEERAAAFAIVYHGVQLATLLAVWSLGAGVTALSTAVKASSDTR